MAYVCPVCGTMEADAEHLANHLAVTASLHEGDHAAWLGEHAPDWPDQSPSELGATAVDYAEERSSEDAPRTHEHDDGSVPDVEHTHPDPATETGGQMTPEVRRTIQEARELMEESDDAE